jgi:hypothetical protein
MAVLKCFRVTFQVVLAGSGQGLKYSYRGPLRQATIAAASAAAVPGVLAGDVSVSGSYALEIVDMHEEPSSEGLLT